MTVYTQPITISCYIGLNTQPHVFTSLPHRLFITVNIQRPAQCLAHGHKIIHIPWSKCGDDHKIVGPTGFVAFPETDSLLGRTLVNETQTLAGSNIFWAGAYSQNQDILEYRDKMPKELLQSLVSIELWKNLRCPSLIILDHVDSDGLIIEEMFLVKSPCTTQKISRYGTCIGTLVFLWQVPIGQQK